MTVGGKTKALCVATRCESAEQFVDSFHRFCDESSFFVATLNMRPVGLETPFSIQLADRTPMLRGICVVLEAWSTPANRFGRPGIRLGIRRLTADGERMFARLQQRRQGGGQPGMTEVSAVALVPEPPPLPALPLPPLPAPPPLPGSASASSSRASPRVTKTNVVLSAAPVPPVAPDVPAVPSAPPVEARTVEPERTPGSDLVLPANPLMNLTDESLEGFVDCTLYEETGNFFRAEDDPGGLIELDPIVPPPTFTAPAPLVRAAALPAPPAVELASLAPAAIETAPAAVAARPTPIPLGARGVPGERMASSQFARGLATQRWWLYAGTAAAAIVVAIVVLVIATDASSAEPETATARAVPSAPRVRPADPAPAPAVAAATTTDRAATIDEATDDADDEGDEATVERDAAVGPGGAPIVGDGPCRLDITTTPAGTRVSLDQKVIGPSPISINGPCERRRVDLAHPRYKAVTQWVTPAPGEPRTVDVTLTRPTHQLSVRTIPSGAAVSIAGRRAGTSPTVVKVMGFQGMDVTVTKRGYKPVTKRVYSKQAADKLVVPLQRVGTYKW